jgi:PPOX class probable F420-dependent enzyme
VVVDADDDHVLGPHGIQRTVEPRGGRMARDLSADERREFLLEGTRTGKVATTRADGRPHVTTVWFTLDGPTVAVASSGFAATVGDAAIAADEILFTTHETSLKAKAIRRDPRVAMCVDDQQPPFTYVLVEGTATLSDDLAELRRVATAVGGRYMGADRAGEFGARNAVPGELVVRITPTHIVARADIAD